MHRALKLAGLLAALAAPTAALAQPTPNLGNVTANTITVSGIASAASYSIGGQPFLSAPVPSQFGANVVLGVQAGISLDPAAIETTIVGYSAGGSQGTGMVGPENTCLGWWSCASMTTGHHNTAVGAGFLFETTGGSNVSVGTDSMRNVVGTNASVSVGQNAMRDGVGLNQETAIGASAMQGSPGAYTGSSNTAVGAFAMQGTAMTTAQQNAAVGAFSLRALTTGAANSCLGYDSCSVVTTATGNTGIGQHTLNSVTTGNYNTVVGSASGKPVTTSNSTIVGALSAPNMTGGQNTIVGSQVAPTLTTGIGNILIGTSNLADVPAATSNYMINIGGVFYGNHQNVTPPTVSACGTSPAIDTHANNHTGMVTAGSGTVTSCAVTFPIAYQVWNHCKVSSQSAISIGYTYTLAAMTITGASLTGAVFDYSCEGQ
jgi:hypothetical protein